jgi:hypothetical protein
VHNQSLHRFWEDELGKDTDRLSPEEKEEQQRQKAKQLLLLQA